VEVALRDLEVGDRLVMAPVAMSMIEVEDYSTNLWGRDIRTLYNVNQKDSRDFLRLAGDLDLSSEVEVYPFEDLNEAMIRLKRGQPQAPNVVLQITCG
jgi:D-arabinose 1-dehydrogenase-like Zn-dependent alcohol dehydrogenase